MSFRLFLAVSSLALSLSGSTALQGTTLPVNYPLGEILGGQSQIVDPSLETWLMNHGEKPSPLQLDEKSFKKFLEKQDELTRHFLRLEWALKFAKLEGIRAEIDDTLKFLALGKKEEPTSKKKDLRASHPLVSMLYASLLKSQALSTEESSQIWSEINTRKIKTCYQKQFVLDRITSQDLATITGEKFQEFLEGIASYKSQNFKRIALRKVISSVPENRQDFFAPLIFKAAQTYPGLVRNTPWLKAFGEKSGNLRQDEQTLLDLEEVQQIASKGQCSKAQEDFSLVLDRIKEKKNPSFLDPALSVSKAIDGCLKQTDPKNRLDFLTDIASDLQDVFGFKGWAEARLRLAYILWTSDQFDQARTVFEEVRKKIESGGSGDQSANFRPLAARALYSLAKIAENEGAFEKAQSHYLEYVKSYGDQANIEEVLMALVLIHTDKGEWSQAMVAIDSMIGAQSLLPLNERSSSAMSFALFWSGRVHLEQGHTQEAAEMWRRAASEYYSTYYGAMGHYLLEQLTGKKFLIEPWRAPPFQLSRYLELLTQEDQAQVEKVLALLRLGFKTEATCELEEVDLADGKPEKLLLKSLILHASGQLLDAIKAFDNLPRSLRHTLPSGFERILFPRRYYDDVKSLAQKAEVDPDLVMAIIRQESVFNPAARSPVGALGLMQLMPATAKVEAKRLSSFYLSSKEREATRLKAKNPANLLEADTNLKLGVHHLRTLLQKFGSPIYVLSAYNASPSAAQKWMNTIPTKDVLSFIEKIPYKETRAYVKLVLRNYFYYKRWYGDPTDEYKHLDTVARKLIAMAKISGKDGLEIPR